MQSLWVICHDNGSYVVVTAERLSWDLARVTSKYIGSSQCWGALIGSLLFIIYNEWWAAIEYQNLESDGQNRVPRFLSIIQKSQGSVKLSDQPWLCFCKLSGAIWITVDQNMWWRVLCNFRKLLSKCCGRESTPHFSIAKWSVMGIDLQVIWGHLDYRWSEHMTMVAM